MITAFEQAAAEARGDPHKTPTYQAMRAAFAKEAETLASKSPHPSLIESESLTVSCGCDVIARINGHVVSMKVRAAARCRQVGGHL